MPLTFLVDPTQVEIRPWMDENNNNAPINTAENPVAQAKLECDRVRALCRAKGIPLTNVPVIHRRNHKQRVRFWNLQEGTVGSSNYCNALCDTGFRLATAEEVQAHLEKAKHDKVEYARRKLRYDAQAVKQVSAQHTLQTLVDAAYSPEEALEELNTEEIDKLQAQLDALKAKTKAKTKQVPATPAGSAKDKDK